jgi:hypothetical protein
MVMINMLVLSPRMHLQLHVYVYSFTILTHLHIVTSSFHIKESLHYTYILICSISLYFWGYILLVPFYSFLTYIFFLLHQDLIPTIL